MIASRRAEAGAARPQWRFGEDTRSVSDVLGSVLLVGITVVMAAAFGLLLLSYDGPARLTRAEVAASVDPGLGGWGTGDETIRLTHRGGDPLAAARTVVLIGQGGATTSLTGTTQLASVFADGRLSIGEVWQRAATIQQGQTVAVRVVSTDGDASILLSEAALVAAQTTSTQPCTSDTAPPTVLQWTQSPAIVTGQTVGAITITAQLTDACWGVNPAVTPSLLWRVSPRDTNFTNAGAMTSVGVATWRATIPAQTWSSLVGQSLQYYLAPVSDLGANSGVTATRSVTILSDCSSDTTPPTVVSIVQSPLDVRSNTLTAVTVTVVFSDDCAGVNQAVAPHLHSRINSGSNPAYTDQTPGGMTLTGTSTWQGSIPNPTWALFAGQTLEYYVQGQSDANGNVGTTATQSDVIDLLATYTYATSNTVTTGSVASFTNLQSATDSGAAATLAEGGTTGSPTTQVFNANGIINANGWVSAGGTRIAASDDLYATYATNNPTSSNDLQASLSNPVTSTGTITRVVLAAEVSIVGYNNDGFELRACLEGGSCTAYSSTGGQSSSDVTMTYDITSIRPGGGSWSWTDITNLEGVVGLVQQGSRDGTWRVDRVWAEVTFTTTTYSMSIRLDWTGIPTGVTQNLDLRYATTADTFNVQVCTWVAGACSTFNTRGTTLNAAGLTTWQYTLLPTELSAGKIAIRFIDVTPSGTAQGNLNLDYARVQTL